MGGDRGSARRPEADRPSALEPRRMSTPVLYGPSAPATRRLHPDPACRLPRHGRAGRLGDRWHVLPRCRLGLQGQHVQDAHPCGCEVRPRRVQPSLRVGGDARETERPATPAPAGSRSATHGPKSYGLRPQAPRCVSFGGSFGLAKCLATTAPTPPPTAACASGTTTSVTRAFCSWGCDRRSPGRRPTSPKKTP